MGPFDKYTEKYTDHNYLQGYNDGYSHGKQDNNDVPRIVRKLDLIFTVAAVLLIVTGLSMILAALFLMS